LRHLSFCRHDGQLVVARIDTQHHIARLEVPTTGKISGRRDNAPGHLGYEDRLGPWPHGTVCLDDHTVWLGVDLDDTNDGRVFLRGSRRNRSARLDHGKGSDDTDSNDQKWRCDFE
jgi:hypothetical protein